MLTVASCSKARACKDWRETERVKARVWVGCCVSPWQRRRWPQQKTQRPRSIHLDIGKPLLCGSDDDGLLGAPVIRVSMLVLERVQHHPSFPEGLNDGSVALRMDMQSRKPLAGLFCEAPSAINGAVRRQPQVPRSEKVFVAMARSGVDQAGGEGEARGREGECLNGQAAGLGGGAVKGGDEQLTLCPSRR